MDESPGEIRSSGISRKAATTSSDAHELRAERISLLASILG